MKPNNEQPWQRFQEHYAEFASIGLALDLSRMNFGQEYFTVMEPQMRKAWSDMEKLEQGQIANPDEKRMVGHYWLRNPALAPSKTIRQGIQESLRRIKEFAAAVHRGEVHGANGLFKNLLLIGIGGSALGPQFVAHALGNDRTDKMRPFFFDNTDPDGMDKVLAQIPDLGKTLCVVTSKSGGTPETRNGMLEAKAAYELAGLSFESHAIAITCVGSDLDKLAKKSSWMTRFPMWEWVGGRTSELSAVGLLPAALQGIRIDDLIAGTGACDEVTRKRKIRDNPAAQLALMWHWACNGKGSRDMVIIPYKDRLELFSRYLQQLIMESLGKELDLNEQVVNQGIAVYGNKGSTDQHAYVQQLRDGVNNFFVTFIEVLRDRQGPSIEVEHNVTSGDYLASFLQGTKKALSEKGRDSMTITIPEVTPYSIGVLIALFERAVGFYASFNGINAYHQPGVEAGKKAAESLLTLQKEVIEHLNELKGKAFTVDEIALAIRAEERKEDIFRICEHLAANPNRGFSRSSHKNPFKAMYQRIAVNVCLPKEV
jgi:glucose-6-phosphate isomerase